MMILYLQRPQYHDDIDIDIDDIVHTASTILFAQSKISPSGDHPVLAIDLKPTASC